MNKNFIFRKSGAWQKMICMLCILSCTPFVVFAQQRVSGTVIDAAGASFAGVNIVEKGVVSSGTITDANGNFTLNVQSGATLVVSFIGYVTQEIVVGTRSELRITLIEDSQALEEVVVVGYGAQKRSTLTGSVAVVKSEQLTVAPVGNVTNALTGKLSGLVTRQNSGMPGSDQASLNIRGFGTPLIIVDGVEANITNLDMHQIENISILKDGAASIYGARAGNGVILVTTKRGLVQKPTITLNTDYTLQGVTNMAKTLSSGQWAQLARERHLNAGLPEETAPFTAEDVAKYFAGNDPAYPSSDWYSFTFRKWAPQQNHNLSIRGGSEKIKYMGFFGYQKQETMAKRNGGDFSRFNIQSNIDATITSRLTLSVDLLAEYANTDFAGRLASSSYWQDLYTTRPWYPTTLPDPSKLASGGIDTGSAALSSNKEIYGYTLRKNRDLRGSVTFSYDVPFIDGLKAKAFINYRDWQTYGKNFSKPYSWYTYNYSANEYTLIGSSRTAADASESVEFNRQLTQQYSLNYDRLFGNVHHLTALALFESVDYAGNNFSAARRDFLTPEIEQLFAGSTASQTNNGSASEMGRASVIGRINYSYDDKYLLETILRADASAKFSEEKRWGYFPSVSLGWIISREQFMRSLSALDFLKLRAGYGSSGYDAVGNFQYLTGFQIGGIYQWGDRFVSGLATTGMANPLLTWEKMGIYNVGVDFSMLKRKIYGSLETFYRMRNGIPATRNISVPSTFGATMPMENINSLKDRGFELSLGTAGTQGDFIYDITANLSWSRAKWDHYDEPLYEDPDQKRLNQRSGQWTDCVVGYIADGLFTSQEEINALPYQYAALGGNGSLRPGDVKYKDINGDGVLDWKDQQEIGKGSTPHWFYGLNASFSYKGFDLVAMFQGAFGYSTSIAGIYTFSDTYYKLRWTEANNNSQALIPRPEGSVSNGLVSVALQTAAASEWTSDYLLKSTFYLRLKNISLGYTLPKEWVNKVGIEKVRLHISGTNLFTLSSLSKYYIDPEAPSGSITAYYPQQRTISFGLNLNF